METWAQASWWAGLALATLSLAIIALALFRDRARGRRRCPNCWYDMSAVTGMTCPECGRTQKKERRFFRTRRRWPGVAAGGVLLVLASATVIAPAAYTGKWTKYTPMPVLRVALWPFGREAKHVTEGVTWIGAPKSLSPWSRLLLASDLSRRLRKGFPRVAFAPGWRIHDTESALAVLEQLGDEVKPALPEMAALLRDPARIDAAVRSLIALRRSADSGVPYLTKLLSEKESPATRHAALYVLVRVAPDDERASRAIRRQLETGSDPVMRMDAAAALRGTGRIDDNAMLDTVIAASKCDNFEGRELAVLALIVGHGSAMQYWLEFRKHEAGHRPGDMICNEMNQLLTGSKPDIAMDQRTCRALADELSDPALDVRRLAIGGLATLPKGFELPRDMLSLLSSETDPGMRRSLLVLFTKCVRENDPRLLDALIAEISNKALTAPARARAAEALQRFGHDAAKAIPALTGLAHDDPDHAAVDVCAELTRIGQEGWDVIDDRLRAPGAERQAFMMGLSNVADGDKGAAARLMSAVTDGDEELRILGIKLIVGLEGAGDPLERAARADPSPDARIAALDSLQALLENERLIRACARAAGDAEARVRARGTVLETHLQLDSAGALGELRSLASDDNAAVRAWAKGKLDTVIGSAGPKR